MAYYAANPYCSHLCRCNSPSDMIFKRSENLCVAVLCCKMDCGVSLLLNKTKLHSEKFKQKVWN